MQLLQLDRAERTENPFIPFCLSVFCNFDLLLGIALYDCQLEFLFSKSTKWVKINSCQVLLYFSFSPHTNCQETIENQIKHPTPAPAPFPILKETTFQELNICRINSPRSGGCAGAGGPRGAIPRSRSGGAAVRRYPSSKVRSSGCALLEQP